MKLRWNCSTRVNFWLTLFHFFKWISIQCFKKQNKRKNTPTTQPLHQVPDVYTPVCSSLTRLIKCVLSQWHMQLCVHVFAFVSMLCAELVTTEARLHGECRRCQADSLQPNHRPKCQATMISSHRTAPARGSLVVLMQRCTEPNKVWKPAGQVLLLWAYHCRSDSVCSWSLPSWRCSAGLDYVSI